MSPCLILLAHLCLFDPSGIVLEADTSWQVSGDFQYFLHVPSRPYSGPIGRAVLSVGVPVSHRLEFRYGLEHRSYLDTSADRGEERGFIGFTWKPFSRITSP